ncbi:MAG: hypothetical protein K5776_07365 [Lachnospiraceae bacterium]|nr:hypothetical protein [Lachnospiraceae bacterium]
MGKMTRINRVTFDAYLSTLDFFA